MIATAEPSLELERAELRAAMLPSGGTIVELLRARYRSHRFAPHWHDTYAIGVVDAGVVRCRVASAVVLAAAGQIVVIEPGVVHTGEPGVPLGYAYRMLYVPAEIVRLAACDGADAGLTAGALPAFPRPVIDDPALAEQLRRAHAALMAPDADAYAAEDDLLAALAALRRRWGERPRSSAERSPPRLARVVRDYLEDHCARVVTLTELARLTGRNPFYLSRTFRSTYGVPPYAYLSLARVRRARELLAAGRSPSMVAHAAGFADQSHFNRQFKRVAGVTPGQFARAMARAGPGRGGRGLDDRIRSTG